MQSFPSYQRPLDEPVWGRSSYDIHHNTSAMQSSSVLTQSPCPHHTTVVQSSAKPPAESDIYRVGIYGWRKRCLYFFICALTIIVILNLMVTIWLLRVLDISEEGMGAMKIGDDSLRIIGEAQFERPVRFNELSTSKGGTLKIESSGGVNIIARNITGHQTAALNMNADGKTEAICDQFEIWDNSKKQIFFTNSKEVGMKLENLRVLDDGGSVFEGAIQTGMIRSLSNKPLSLESPTRSLKLDAGQDIELNSAAGEIQISSLNDITLSSKKVIAVQKDLFDSNQTTYLYRVCLNTKEEREYHIISYVCATTEGCSYPHKEPIAEQKAKYAVESINRSTSQFDVSVPLKNLI